MKILTNGQNFQIDSGRKKLQDAGVNLFGYIFVSGYDVNSTSPEDVTAFGMQHSSVLTVDDNSKDIDEKKASVLLVDGEHIIIDGVEYVVKFLGMYSDMVHFHEV